MRLLRLQLRRDDVDRVVVRRGLAALEVEDDVERRLAERVRRRDDPRGRPEVDLAARRAVGAPVQRHVRHAGDRHVSRVHVVRRQDVVGREIGAPGADDDLLAALEHVGLGAADRPLRGADRSGAGDRVDVERRIEPRAGACTRRPGRRCGRERRRRRRRDVQLCRHDRHLDELALELLARVLLDLDQDLEADESGREARGYRPRARPRHPGRGSRRGRTVCELDVRLVRDRHVEVLHELRVDDLLRLRVDGIRAEHDAVTRLEPAAQRAVRRHRLRGDEHLEDLVRRERDGVGGRTPTSSPRRRRPAWHRGSGSSSSFLRYFVLVRVPKTLTEKLPSSWL